MRQIVPYGIVKEAVKGNLKPIEVYMIMKKLDFKRCTVAITESNDGFILWRMQPKVNLMPYERWLVPEKVLISHTLYYFIKDKI